MKFRYIIIPVCEGPEVTGTNSPEIAEHFSDVVNYRVIDCFLGKLLHDSEESTIEREQS